MDIRGTQELSIIPDVLSIKSSESNRSLILFCLSIKLRLTKTSISFHKTHTVPRGDAYSAYGDCKITQYMVQGEFSGLKNGGIWENCDKADGSMGPQML